MLLPRSKHTGLLLVPLLPILVISTIFMALVYLTNRIEDPHKPRQPTTLNFELWQLPSETNAGGKASEPQTERAATTIDAALALIFTTTFLSLFWKLLHTSLPGDERAIIAILESKALKDQAHRKSRSILQGLGSSADWPSNERTSA